MNRVYIALACGLIFAVFYAVTQSLGSFLVLSTDILFVIVSGVTSILAYRVVKALEPKDSSELVSLRQKMRPVHVGFFLAIFFWFLGELIWAFYEVVLSIQVPYPSIADVFYLAGYFPAIIVLIQFMWIFRNMITRPRLVIASLSGVIVVGLTFMFLLNPLSNSSSDALTKMFDLTYPILDSIVLVLVTIKLIGFSGTKIGKPLLWISCGFFLNSIADIMFSWGTLTGWYYSGHPVELLWLYGYIAFALGFDSQRLEFQALTRVKLL